MGEIENGRSDNLNSKDGSLKLDKPRRAEAAVQLKISILGI
jgi:hypothetical protein